MGDSDRTFEHAVRIVLAQPVSASQSLKAAAMAVPKSGSGSRLQNARGSKIAFAIPNSSIKGLKIE